MGGFGSGRPVGVGRDKVEFCRSLDVNRVQKTGCLSAGWSGGWQWTRDGDRSHGFTYAPRLIGCISPIERALRAASGKTLRRPSASSACLAALVARGPISSVPVW